VEEQRANQAVHPRRRRIEHVNRSVQCCRLVKDRIRLWKQGVRDLVMELCCTLHLLYAPLTIPLVYCHIKSFQRASRVGRGHS
jgi:hypothetical protein